MVCHVLKNKTILSFHTGKCDKVFAEVLMKKNHGFIQINLQFTIKLSHGNNIVQLEKNLVRRVILKDLTA